MQTLRYACAALMLIAGCDAMKASPRPLAKTAMLELYVVSPTKTASSKAALGPGAKATIFLETPAVVSAPDVATVQLSKAEPDSPSLIVNLTPGWGREKSAAATAQPTGMRVAVVVNGSVLAVPKVVSQMSTGFRVTGEEFSKHGEQLFETLTKN